MKTAELEGKILDYYVALAVGHVWRYKWMMNDEWEPKTYTEWQQAEYGHGNPTPPYSSDWAFCGPLIERFELRLSMAGRHAWRAKYFETGDFDHVEGKNPQEAICRAVVAFYFGPDVPDVKL